MAPKKTVGKYYKLLEVPTDADAAAIKKAYRKKALLWHPDKVGDTPENNDRFQQLQKAYDTLSDPDKRALYDQYGERGVNMVGSVDTMGLVDAKMLKRINSILLAIAFFMAVQMLFPAFLAVKIDGKVSWNWAIVFIPLFVVDLAIVNLLLLFRVPLDSLDKFDEEHAFGTPEDIAELRKEHEEKVKRRKARLQRKHRRGGRTTEEGANSDGEDTQVEEDENTKAEDEAYERAINQIRTLVRTVKFTTLVVMSLVIIFEVFLVVRLNNTVSWSWGVVFIPIYILELFGVIGSLVYFVMKVKEGKPILNPGDEEKGIQPTIGRRPLSLLEGIWQFIDSFIVHIVIIVQAVLIALKADKSIDCKWSIVFLPIWIYGFFIVLGMVESRRKFKRASKALHEEHEHGKTTAEEEHGLESANHATYTLGLFVTLFFSFMLYLGMGLLTRRLDHQDRAHPNRPTAAAILAPLFIIFGILILCFGCCLPCMVLGARMSMEKDEEEEEEEEGNEGTNEEAADGENKASENGVVDSSHRIAAPPTGMTSSDI